MFLAAVKSYAKHMLSLRLAAVKPNFKHLPNSLFSNNI